METAVRPVLDQLKFQVALVKTDLLFEACDRLEEADRQVLYEEIRGRLERIVFRSELAIDASKGLPQGRALNVHDEEKSPTPALIEAPITRLLRLQNNRDALFVPAAFMRSNTPGGQRNVVDTLNSTVDEDSIFAGDISDEELETAAGAARVTMAACTGVWSTFCNS